MLDSVRSVRVAQPQKPAQQALQFNQERLETFAERLLRKHILSQHVESDHPVARTEEKLVGDSTRELKREMESLAARGHHIHLVQMELFARVRTALRVLIRLHDVDDDIAESAVLRAVQEAFARLVQHVSAQGGT